MWKSVEMLGCFLSGLIISPNYEERLAVGECNTLC